MSEMTSAQSRDRDDARLQEVADAMSTGTVLVDTQGKVVWLDPAARRRINGGLTGLVLPVPRPQAGAVDCFAMPMEITVDGETLRICVLQQAGEDKSGSEMIAIIESLMADGSSWFASVVERLKAMRQGPSEPPPTPPTAALDALSNREREVLGLICEGLSDLHMSEQLGLSENTVRNHIASLYRKIGVNRRTAAIIWARERGITGRAAAVNRHRHHNGNGRGGSPAY